MQVRPSAEKTKKVFEIDHHDLVVRGCLAIEDGTHSMRRCWFTFLTHSF